MDAVRYMKESIRSDGLFFEFPSFKDGASIGAAPSPEYHADVVKLYEKILDRAEKSGNRFSFHKWHDRLGNFWDAVQNQEFSLRFKNILDFQDFLERGDRIALIKELLFLALKHHETSVKVEIQQLALQKWDANRRRDEAFERVVIKSTQFLAHCQQGFDPDSVSMTSSTEADCEDDMGSMIHLVSKSKKTGRDEDASRSIEDGELRCDACKKAEKELGKFCLENEGKHFAEEVKNTIAAFVDKCMVDIRARLREHLIGLEIRGDNMSKFGEIINDSLKSILDTRPSTDDMSSVELENYIDQIWQRLVRKVAETCDDVTAVRRKIFEEISREFADKEGNQVQLTPLMGLGYDEGVDIFKDLGFRSRHIDGMPGPRPPVHFFRSDDPRKDELTGLFQKIPAQVLETTAIRHYQLGRGLAKIMRDMIIKVMETFQNKHKVELVPRHKYMENGVILFMAGILKIESEWLKTHSPMEILLQREEFYKNKIGGMLKYGISLQAEATSFAYSLQEASKSIAMETAENHHRNYILAHPWLTSSENIRLKYFSELALKIEKDGLCDGAMEHFTNPQASILKWFNSQVDGMDTKERKKQFKTCLQDETNQIINRIRAASSIPDILKFGQTYIFRAGFAASEISGMETVASLQSSKSVVGQSKGSPDPETADDLNSFRHRILDMLRTIEVKPTFLPASADAAILRRLGCTCNCPFCGALCWGQLDHGTNEDSTKRHHTSHQPQGLKFLYNKRTKELLPTACHEENDKATLYWGKYHKKGISWKRTKESEGYRDWLFTPHAKSEFNHLMLWFFVRLNKQLVAAGQEVGAELKPTLPTKLETLVANVRIDEILADIHQRIGLESANSRFFREDFGTLMKRRKRLQRQNPTNMLS